MKSIFANLLFLFMSFQFLNAQQQLSVEWKSIQEALDMKKNNKFIFIDFYTTWCGWCKRMDQTTFTDNRIIQFLNTHFIPVKFNAEGFETVTYKGQTFRNQANPSFRSTHPFTFHILGQRVGYPSFAILDEKNDLILIIPGYQSPENLLNILEYVQTKSYLTMTWEQWNTSRQKK